MTRYSAEYLAYLKSETWAKVRGRALNSAGHRCEHCHRGPPQVQWLEVNHKHYRKPFGQERWPDDLEALCPSCHKRADDARRKANRRRYSRRRVSVHRIFAHALKRTLRAILLGAICVGVAYVLAAHNLL